MSEMIYINCHELKNRNRKSSQFGLPDIHPYWPIALLSPARVKLPRTAPLGY